MYVYKDNMNNGMKSPSWMEASGWRSMRESLRHGKYLMAPQVKHSGEKIVGKGNILK